MAGTERIGLRYIPFLRGVVAVAEDDNITLIIDGHGSVITAGIKGYLEIPFACTIKRATLLADKIGSIEMDIGKSTYASFPPFESESYGAGILSIAIDDTHIYAGGVTTQRVRKYQKSNLAPFLNSIVAAAPPKITNTYKSQDMTLTGWTTKIADGDILAFYVSSCTTITLVTATLNRAVTSGGYLA